MTRFRGGRPLLAVLALLAALLAPGTAHADDREEMYRALGVDAAGADYLFLIDKSGSMRDSFPSLQDNLKRFAAALGDGDRVALVPFGAQAEPGAWLPARSAQATTAVDQLPEPSPSPTDFYQALSWTVDYLAKDTTNAGRVATVVLLTDGDPAGGGLPDCQLPPDSAWRAVRAKAAKLAESRAVNAYALPVATPAKECADVTALSVLKLAFPAAEPLDPSKAQTGIYLDQAKEGTRALGAQHALKQGDELTKPVTVTWPGDLGGVDPTNRDVRVVVRLDTTGRSPLRVSRLAARFTGSFTDGDGLHPQDLAATVSPGEVLVEPGKPATVTLSLTWPAAAGTVAEQTVAVKGTLTLQGTVTSPYAELAGGGLATKVTSALSPAQVAVSGSAEDGVPDWVFAALLATAVGAFLFFTLRFLARRPRMSDALLVVLPSGRPVTVDLHNKRWVGPQPLGDRDGTVEVRGVRTGGRRGMTVTYTPHNGTAESKQLPKGGAVMIRGVDFRHVPEHAPAAQAQPAA